MTMTIRDEIRIRFGWIVYRLRYMRCDKFGHRWEPSTIAHGVKYCPRCRTARVTIMEAGA